MMSWEETRGRFEELELEHERASSESEAAAIIEKVIALAESFMASSADEWRFSHVYGVIAAWLAKSDRLWEWVKHRCVIAASDNERIALNVSILELFAEEPTDAYWNEKLLELLLDRRTWWAIADAYSSHPGKLHLDFDRVVQAELFKFMDSQADGTAAT